MGQRILLLSEVFPPKTGGSGRWFWEIYRRMPRGQVVIGVGEDARQEAFDRTHDLPIQRLPLTLPTWGTCSWRGLRGYFRLFLAVRQLVRRERIGRLHCGKLLPEGWAARLLKATRGLPYVCYVHGEELSYGVISRELGWLMRRVLQGADYVIANSRNTVGLLERRWHVPESRIRLLHPGVDVEQFSPAARDAAVREALGWHDRPVVLTVGRLQKRKGHDQLIRALRQVRQVLPNVLYSIAGDGEERECLEQLVQTEGVVQNVQFRGEVSDEELVRCYQQCDLFVLPNREINGDIEGFGMVLLEAQACEKPAIAGDSGGTAETMCEPVTGRIVPCDGPDMLSRVVAELLQDPALCERMGEAGRRWTVERFSWDALARQAQEMFFPEVASVGDLAPVRQ